MQPLVMVPTIKTKTLRVPPLHAAYSVQDFLNARNLGGWCLGKSATLALGLLPICAYMAACHPANLWAKRRSPASKLRVQDCQELSMHVALLRPESSGR